MSALERQIAVVTGGSQGIGRGVCLRLAQEGARVAILDIGDAAETRELIAGLGADSWYRRTDIADPGAIEDAFAALQSDWGAPRALANVAGVFDDVPFLDTTEAVVWLLSDARWLTGQVIYVDGGFMAAGLPYLEGLERPAAAT